jgi:hypothetical protein
MIYDDGYGRGAMFGDFNHDGFQDIIVNMDQGNTKVYMNNGNGTFSDATATSGITYCEEPTSCSIADIDGDGDLDLYISDKCMKNKMLLNRCNDSNFLRVKLVGSVSNRFGIGSKICLYNQNDSLLQYRELCVGKARLAMCEPVAHFGIEYGPLYRIRVIFPSGITVDSANVDAAQTITIYEIPTGKEEMQPRERASSVQLICKTSNLSAPYRFRLISPEHKTIVSALIFNILGRKVAEPHVILNSNHLADIVWNGQLDNGGSASKGVYVLRVELKSRNAARSSVSAKIIKLTE